MNRTCIRLLTKLLPGGMAVVAILSGCQELSAAHAEMPYIPDSETLGGLQNPPASAVLNLAGTPVVVEVRAEDHIGGVPTKCYELLKHGEMLDRECYSSSSEAFALVEASNLTFMPAIPLVRYGDRLGKDLVWRGMAEEGSTRYKASAKIKSGEASLSVNGVDHDTTLVTMDLVLDASGVGGMSSNSVTKRLTLWIHPKLGVIQREFGTTKRSPAGDRGMISSEGPTLDKAKGVPEEKKVETVQNPSSTK